MRLRLLLAATVLFCGFSSARADTVAYFSFDSLPKGPSTFAASGSPQTVAFTGVATFSGGAVLGNATNLPGLQYATAPNAYGAAGFATGYANLLTIAIDPTFTANEVSFALLNGATMASSYLVQAFNGSSLLTSQTFLDVPANTASGFALPDLHATNITSVTVQSLTNDPNVSGFDFFIDSVAFNQSVNQAVSVTPEPSSFALLGTGAFGIFVAARRRLNSE